MEIKDLAVSAAKRAGALIKEHVGRAGAVEYKGTINIVTEMDRRSEAQIIGDIRASFPDHGILTEESAEMRSNTGFRWIIDPIDGTTNYAHGFPFFCVSIAFEAAGTVVLGVVYNPMLDELFIAERKNGAYLNGSRISVSGVDNLNRGLLATGFPYDLRSTRQNNLDNFSSFALKAQAIRRAGSAALDLCYVACGRFDGFWEMKLHPWDVAAAALMVEEAGGVVTDFSGNPFTIYDRECLASNGLIQKSMLDVLSEVRGASGR